MVGRSGTKAERLRVETARPRMRPALTCGRAAGPTVNMTWSWPPRSRWSPRESSPQQLVVAALWQLAAPDTPQAITSPTSASGQFIKTSTSDGPSPRSSTYAIPPGVLRTATADPTGYDTLTPPAAAACAALATTV